MPTRSSHAFTDDICIVGGAGHVGLPLGLAFADKGQRVTLYDLDRRALDSIQQGRMPFVEDGADVVLRRVIDRTLFVSADRASVGSAPSIVVTVGTPVDEYLNPDLRAILRAMKGLREYLSPEQTVIIRSTVFPGTCRNLARALGDGVWKIAYCPERIAQGHAIRELFELPQIVSGTTPGAAAVAASLFSLIAPRVIEVSVEEAELVKLFSNAWRYIRFAAANQFYMLSHELGIDYDAVWRAMTDGYARNAGLPTAGLAAGPCLMKDTMQLFAASNGRFSLGHAAMTANEGMPAFLVERLRRSRELRGARVGILGMTFKADIDDTRDSLAYKLRKLLEFHGADVVCSDEYVNDPQFVSMDELIRSSDVIIVGVPHAAYRTLAIPERIEVVDLWGVIPMTTQKLSAAV